MAEILKKINLLISSKPATKNELDLFVRNQILSLPARFERTAAVLSTMIDSAFYRHLYDWAQGTKERLDAITLGKVNQIARQYFQAEKLTWVLVGDLTKLRTSFAL